MSMAAMVKQPPPTPPSADGHQLQDSFGHIMQHNARSEHQVDTYALDNSLYMPSGASSFDNTPEPEMGQWYMDQYGNRSFHPYQEQNNLGVDMSFVSCAKWLAGRDTNEANKLMKHQDAYGHQAFHPQQQGMFNPYALQQQHVSSTQASSLGRILTGSRSNTPTL